MGCVVAKRSAFSGPEKAESVVSVTVHLTALRISRLSDCVSVCEGVSCDANPSRPVHFAWAINHEPNQIVIYNHRMSGILLLRVPHPPTFSLSFNHRVSTDVDRGVGIRGGREKYHGQKGCEQIRQQFFLYVGLHRFILRSLWAPFLKRSENKNLLLRALRNARNGGRRKRKSPFLI